MSFLRDVAEYEYAKKPFDFRNLIDRVALLPPPRLVAKRGLNQTPVPQ